MAVMGFAMGVLDTTGNVSMLELLKENVSPFLQVLLPVPRTSLELKAE